MAQTLRISPFTITNLPADSHLVNVTYPGYVPQEQTITVIENQTKEITIVPQPRCHRSRGYRPQGLCQRLCFRCHCGDPDNSPTVTPTVIAGVSLPRKRVKNTFCRLISAMREKSRPPSKQPHGIVPDSNTPLDTVITHPTNNPKTFTKERSVTKYRCFDNPDRSCAKYSTRYEIYHTTSQKIYRAGKDRSPTLEGSLPPYTGITGSHLRRLRRSENKICRGITPH